MSQQPPDADLDLTDPSTAARYLKICREVLGNLAVAEAVRRFLEEVADRFDGTDSDLASYLRAQSGRIGTGEEVRHAVRQGIPEVARVREQVADRLRREEDRRLARLMPRGRVRWVRRCLLMVGGAVSVGIGAVLWGVLRLVGVGAQGGLIWGAVAALVVFAVFARSLRHALVDLGGADD
jgi:hypothetical protein